MFFGDETPSFGLHHAEAALRHVRDEQRTHERTCPDCQAGWACHEAEHLAAEESNARSIVTELIQLPDHRR